MTSCGQRSTSVLRGPGRAPLPARPPSTTVVTLSACLAVYSRAFTRVIAGVVCRPSVFDGHQSKGCYKAITAALRKVRTGNPGTMRLCAVPTQMSHDRPACNFASTFFSAGDLTAVLCARKAEEGDTIIVEAGTYMESLTVKIPVAIKAAAG
jgi:hypothetical protein